MENKYKKKILFVGMPDMAIICLERLVKEGFNLVGVVPPHYTEGTFGLMANYAKAYGLPLVGYERRLDEFDFIRKIRQLDADLAVVCSYNKKFPQELLKSVKGGFVNCHPSYLPDYRGANPYSNVIINNETETGITLHYMDENFDTGNIICRQKVPIMKNDTMGTLFNKMNFIAAEMLTEFLKEYDTAPEIQSYPQPEGDFIKATSIDQSNGKNLIDWGKDAKYIERLVRALNPFISAMTSFRGVFVKVNSAEVSDKNPKAEPGTICHVKDTIGLATGTGILHIKSLQFGSYMVSDSKSFIEMFKPQVGEKFGL